MGDDLESVRGGGGGGYVYASPTIVVVADGPRMRRRGGADLDGESAPPPALSREQRIRRAVRSATARWNALCCAYVWPVWRVVWSESWAQRRERWELWRERAAAYRDANAVRCWAALSRYMCRLACAALLMALLGGFSLARHFSSSSTADDDVLIAHPLGFLRENEPGGESLRLPSAPLQCGAHLQNENAPLDAALLTVGAPRTLAALRDASVRALSSEWRCVCAPMFGARVRMTSVGGGAAATTHLYDVTLEPVPEKGRVLLSEPLAHLFPRSYAEPRAGVLRYNEVLAHYRALGSCEQDTFVLRGKAAYCVQTCDDLMAGNVL